jgi:hypothetical protein
MHNAIPLVLAVLVAVGILIIGSFYLVSPERILGGFGLRPPAPDADTRAWLRLKGMRKYRLRTYRHGTAAAATDSLPHWQLHVRSLNAP